MLAGAHTFALALLIGGAAAGLFQVQRAALVRYLFITAVLTILSLGGLRLFYEYGATRRGGSSQSSCARDSFGRLRGVCWDSREHAAKERTSSSLFLNPAALTAA